MKGRYELSKYINKQRLKQLTAQPCQFQSETKQKDINKNQEQLIFRNQTNTKITDNRQVLLQGKKQEQRISVNTIVSRFFVCNI